MLAGDASRHSDASVFDTGRRRRLSRLDAQNRNRAAKVAEAKPQANRRRRPQRRRSYSTALKIDDLKIEFGYALLPLVNGPDGTDRLTEQIKALRRSLAIEMGS